MIFNIYASGESCGIELFLVQLQLIALRSMGR